MRPPKPVGNDALVYERRKKVHETKQGDMTVAQYFAELSSLWQELDFYQDFQADCPSDAAKFQKLIEKERVYDFLAGLQTEFDPIRVQVLGGDPFPSLRETYAYVQQEESRRSVMLHQISHERSALVTNSAVKGAKGNLIRANDQSQLDKDQLKCDHCGRTRHTRDTCWKLHGRPTRGRGGRGGSVRGTGRPQAYQSDVVEAFSQEGGHSESNSLSHEDLFLLRKLMSKLETSSSNSISFPTPASSTSNFSF